MKLKRVLVIILTLLFFLLAGGGIYLLISKQNLLNCAIEINTYPEILNWCDTHQEDKNLSITCNALLINIRTNEGNENCFDTQILSNKDGVKEFTFCGNSQNLSYSNEILEYKTLKPITVQLQYEKTNTSNKYTLTRTDLSAQNQEKMQSIINEDITDLTTLDLTTTSIKNSVDFCPAPETLPNYISEANRSNYTTFYEKNKTSGNYYSDGYIYNIDDMTVNSLISCNILRMINKDDSCEISNIKLSTDTKTKLTQTVNPPLFGKSLDDNDIYAIKIASLLYSKTSEVKSEDPSSLISYLLDKLNNELDTNEDLYCYTLSLFSKFKNPEIQNYAQQMKELLKQYPESISSPFCTEALDVNTIDTDGLYLRISQSQINDNFKILSKCLNLYNEINE